MSNSSVNQIAKDLLELSRKLELASASSRQQSQNGSRPATAGITSASGINQRVESSASQRLGANTSQRASTSASQRSINAGSAALNSEISDQSRKLSTARSEQGRGTVLSTVVSSGVSNALSAAAAASQAGSSQFLSPIEQAVLRSNDPIEINDSEEMVFNGLTGYLLNKNEISAFKGPVPIDQYPINQDENPEIITKRPQQTLEYVQELAIRYLRPPTPPAPGEIIINQEPNTLPSPAPPVIIRQQPARPETPEPLVVREAPPQPPAQVGRKVITISGKRLPPPPRKVVIERLAPLPSKPQSVIIERWLPYSEVKRRVIFNKNTVPDPVVVKPRNVIVQWEAPEVNIRKEYKYLGVVRANPVEYVQRYGQSLVISNELPNFVQDINTPDGLVLAADHKSNGLHELEGDLEALRLIDLNKEGLGEYQAYLAKLAGGSSASIGLSGSNAVVSPSQILINNATASQRFNASSALSAAATSQALSNGSNALSVTVASQALDSGLNALSTTINASQRPGSAINASSVIASGPLASNNNSFRKNSQSVTLSTTSSATTTDSVRLNDLIEILFNQIDKENTGLISIEDAERLVLRLNSRLGRAYGEDDVAEFFQVLDKNRDGSLNLDEFKQAFINLTI